VGNYAFYSKQGFWVKNTPFQPDESEAVKAESVIYAKARLGEVLKNIETSHGGSIDGRRGSKNAIWQI